MKTRGRFCGTPNRTHVEVRVELHIHQFLKIQTKHPKNFSICPSLPFPSRIPCTFSNKNAWPQSFNDPNHFMKGGLLECLLFVRRVSFDGQYQKALTRGPPHTRSMELSTLFILQNDFQCLIVHHISNATA